ncbi:MAG: aldehyde dehydrogenase family protein, partial [Lutimaribacter sp.]
MSDLLTTEEYKAIAAALSMPTQAFVDGGFRPAASGATFDTVNPATGDVLAKVAACGAKDVDFAVQKARDAFEDGRWSGLHPSERKAVLIRLAKLIKRNARELAVMESLESGKTIFDCETVDLPETIHCLTWHAELIDKIYDQVSPASDDHIAMVVREPVGVVGLVLPWNFPLLMLAWKIGPALAAGCSVIVKPAEETSLSALRVAELAAEAGLPAGVLNVLPGTGPDVGEPLGRHMDVDALSFTGSTETGRKFLRYAAESNLKEVTLEMGGKNPALVLDDAENLDRVAAHIVNGAFWNMGENCSASSRLIVQRG